MKLLKVQLMNVEELELCTASNYIDCHYTRTGTYTFVIVLSRWEEFSYSVTILLAYYNIELCYCYGFLKTAY